MKSIILAGIVVAHTLAGAAAAAEERRTSGEILVAPAPGGQVAVAEAIVRAGLVILERDAVSGVMRVAVAPGAEADAIDVWQQRVDVRYAERNGLGEGGLVPNDTFFGFQWHLQNTGQFDGTPGADIECVPAWDIVTGSPDVVIAVLDTGIDTDHPEFAGRIDPDGFDFVNEDDDPEADHPHGSWVIGALAANGNNGFAVTGVDWGCQVLPIKVLNANNAGTTFDLAQGLNYCATQSDVDIVSLSLINYPGNSTLIDALQAARDAGKIVIACAGNGGIGDADVSYPGASPLTMSIGATMNRDFRATFSGTGNALDFVAPGDSIVTVQHGSMSDDFWSVSGCSFATPIAAGIAGLLLDRADQLGFGLTHDDIFDLFQNGAEDQVGLPGEDTPGYDTFHGHGRLNAYRSLVALCPEDLDLSGAVDFGDVLAVLAAWGETGGPEDLDGSGVVDFGDIVVILAAWGPCG